MSHFKRPSLVYFMKPIGMDGPVKIGCTSTPSQRLASLAVWSPFPLEIIGTVPGGYKEEMYLHSCFAGSHSHREWFHSTPKMRDAIATIVKEQSIDAAGLSPEGNIRKKANRKPRTDSQRLQKSYACRVRWAMSRLRTETEYHTEPPVISNILYAWMGRPYFDIPGVHPTDDQITLLDKFLSNPTAMTIIHQVHRPKQQVAA